MITLKIKRCSTWRLSGKTADWKYTSWLFPSTFGLNGYVRLTGMGASLDDIAFEYKGLWIQAVAYFLIACLFYRRQIKNLLINRYKE